MSDLYSNSPIGKVHSVELFSPIPPLKTGTAAYFASVVEYITSALGPRNDIVIAVDSKSFESVPSTFAGLQVVDYRQLSDVPSPSTTRVYFLANNAYHAYIHNAIIRSKSLAEGKIITVVHDASVFMLSRHMYGDPHELFSGRDLITCMHSQFSDSASRVFNKRLDDELPMNVEYEIHCLGPALQNSHEVWGHSIFALTRMLLENGITAENFPKLRLAAHALPNTCSAQRSPRSDARFVISLFGWVTEPKRIDAILHGLALALQWLPFGSDRSILLRVVGRKPADWNYSPDQVADSLGLASMVEFIDYPDRDDFERLQFECDLTFNLRYPSTGETSGTFASARTAGTPVITSRYHAFHEVGMAGATVTAIPFLETWAIAEMIAVSFQRWLKGGPVGPAPKEPSPVAPVEKLLLREIAEALLLGDCTHIEVTE